MRVLAISVEGLGISEKMFDAACGFYAAGRRIFTVCDESSRIKNPKALRTERAIKLGEASAYSLILNGTPIALGIQDLWAQFQFLDPNIIGTGDYWAYRTKYLEYGGFEGKQIIGYKNVDELMELLRPYTIEVDKSVLNLPPKINKERYIEATPEQRALFKQIIKGEGSFAPIKVDNALEKVLRLRQVVGGFRPYSAIDQKTGLPITKLAALDKNPKMNDLIEFIEDNFHGSKFIIWTTFRHELLAITDALANKYGSDCVAVYYGDTDMEERSRIEDKYCNGESLKFLVANPASAGLGLTLVSKYDDVMYYYSGTSAFIDRAQSEDRSHRIGQKNTVTIVDAVMEKSVDEIILKATAAKMSIEQWILEQLRQGKKEVDLLEGAF
jgi:SNF2 family DNA or RNA helicase